MPFTFEKTTLDGLTLVKPRVFADDRGFFLESFSKKHFEAAGIRMEVVQINHSRSVNGALRGLHFQYAPFEQAKLVRCVGGEILDVAVDLRPNSSSFGRAYSVNLSESNRFMLYVPRGFAHGFLVLSNNAEVEYAVDNHYALDHEGGVIWNDPDLAINWPTKKPILSDKDKKWPSFKVVSDSLRQR